MKLTNVLPLRGGGILSLVGAGGKTTTLLTLAEELLAAGSKVLITTTTKLSTDMQYNNKIILVRDEHEFFQWISQNQGTLAILANNVIIEEKKIVGIPPLWLEKYEKLLREGWQTILVEADGSRGKSLKANLDHEPQIPGCSDIILVIIGMDILGKPLNHQFAHRAELISRISGTRINDIIDTFTIIKLLEDSAGLLKGIAKNQHCFLLLNKWDVNHSEHYDQLFELIAESKNISLDGIIVTQVEDKNHPVKKVILDV
ncbi:MAG: selenium cofactor biosynthesis protein YqeC [Bacillota bacterium]|nr:selenium cofactor biosynthesis protein YqeC [Bacillota bacterium]